MLFKYRLPNISVNQIRAVLETTRICDSRIICMGHFFFKRKIIYVFHGEIDWNIKFERPCLYQSKTLL